MKNITKKYVQECFEYVDGVLYWKKRPRDHFKSDGRWIRQNRDYAGEVAGATVLHKKTNDRRHRINVAGFNQQRAVWIWIYFNGPIPPGLQVDHIDRNPLNDKIENLRIGTRKDNLRNISMHKRNTSGTNGVYHKQETNKYGTYEYWIAYWQDESGKQKRKHFSVLKYGDDAKQMAADYSISMRQEMGYSDGHGVDKKE